MALSLCHIIRAYGQFVDTHSNIEEIQSYWETFEIKPKEEQVNISQKQTNKTMQEPIDYIVEGFVKETDGVLHIDDVCLPLRKKYQTPGQKFRIEKVIPNTQDNKEKYPYFAIAAGIKEID
jgi:regulator of sigma D